MLSACADERTVYFGGPILTMDATNRTVEALGIEGERIAAVGSIEEVRAWAGSSPREVDLGGRALLPGFIDAHGHFPAMGMYARAADLNSPPIGTVQTREELVERLKAYGEIDTTDWIVGLGYDDSLLQPEGHPTRDDLDRVSTVRPVLAVHISAHFAVANSIALEILGIDATTPDPPGGIIRRDATGRPNGVLEETPAERAITTVTNPGLLGSIEVLREGSRRALAVGVTTVQVGFATSELLAMETASRFGLTPLRLIFWPEAKLGDEALAGTRELRSFDPDWVRYGAIKIIADGSIQGYSAYLSTPYHVAPGDDPHYRGYPRHDKVALQKMVSRFHGAGFQLAIHGNGDAAIDDILDAIEQAQRETPRRDTRHVIVHAQMARADQLDRMRELGVVPSFFVLHTYYWADRHSARFLGPERTARISPLASARDRGLRFTIHCDAPVVPLEPLRLVWSAVHRRSTGGASIGPEERIDPMQALRAITIDAAWQHFEDDRKGSLEPGKFADLVILSRSPVDYPEHIDSITVEETIVAGTSQFRRAEDD